MSSEAGTNTALSLAGKALCVELGKNPAMDSGEIRIRQLGYKQELRRNFTLVSNASIGFTAISILTGITGEPQPLSCCLWRHSSCAAAGHLPLRVSQQP